MKARKKPVEVEIVRFLGFESYDNFNCKPEWLLKAIYEDRTIKFFDKPEKLTIETLEGPIYASAGDYIIRGVEGEIYPCKPDIFDKTYDIIEG